MKYLAFFLGFVLVATSCQKVIDVDLNDANETIVIEANFTGEDSTVNVRVTKTSSFFNSEPSPVVNDAVVTITNQAGVSTTVPFLSNGNYQLSGYAPEYGTSYVISVASGGTTYSATCSMQAPVSLDPITYEFTEGFFGSGSGYFTLLNFQDPAGITNYHQIVITRNSITFDRIDEIQTQDDSFTDGNYVSRPLFFDTLSQIGDTVSYEFRTVDKAIFDYTNEAASISGGTTSAAPGNPTSNWNNGALGYFNAFGVSRDTVVIQ